MIAEWDTNTPVRFNPAGDRNTRALFASLREALNGVRIEIIPATADIWRRDYMPIQLDEDRFCQFVYAPDYLRGYRASCHHSRKVSVAVHEGLPPGVDCPRRGKCCGFPDEGDPD